MGDRALVTMTDGRGFSPVLYTHWGGEAVGELLEAALPRMRKDDLSYSFARLVGVFHEDSEGNRGLGCFGSPWPRADVLAAKPADFAEGDDGSAAWRARREDSWQEARKWREAVWADIAAQIQEHDYSHGDAGVFVVDIRDWSVTAYHGYGFGDGEMTRQLDAETVGT